MVGIAIVGCGAITKQRHAPEIYANSNAKLIGVYDPMTQRAEEISKTYGGKIYQSFKELKEDTSVGAVCICSSNKYHASMTIEALRAGKHVLCEKPMAISEEEAVEMIHEAKKIGKYLMIAHNQRLDPVHRKAKQIIQSGEVGKILSFRTVFGHGGPEGWSADKGAHTWFFKRGEASMGALGDIGIHKADLIRWLIDDEITEISAFVATIDKKDDKGQLIEIDDNAICTLKSSKGIIGTLEASWTYYGEMDNSTTLYCSKGIVKIYDNPQYPIEIIRRDGEKSFYQLPEKNSEIMDAFVNSIITNVPPEISGEEGLKALKIILASMKSSESGQKIEVIY